MQTPIDPDLMPLLERALHDLAQPMASLQLRLEIGKLLGDEASLKEAVDGASKDMERLVAVLSRMRSILAAASEGTR